MRVRHQVVAQLVGVVAIGRRGTGAGVAGHAEALHRSFDQVADGCDRKLHRAGVAAGIGDALLRSEEHTSELQSLMRISYAVFCLKKKTTYTPEGNRTK